MATVLRASRHLVALTPLGLLATPTQSEAEATAPRSAANWRGRVSARWRAPIRCEGAQIGQLSNAVLAPHHRVGLCNWVVRGGIANKDPRVQTLDSLFEHVETCGYDGVEISFVQFKSYYLDSTANGEADGSGRDEEFAEHVRSTASRHGVRVLGATYHIMDGREDVPNAPDFADADFGDKLSRRMTLDRKMGAGYVNFQVFLPPRYMQTALAWREDETYLRETLKRCLLLRNLCWQHGLNAYFETHIDRWGEDPVFFAEVLAKAKAEGGLEVNGDLSHYLYRGFTKGPSVDSVLKAVNHLHVRMCRVHGDLSAETTKEPFDDFAAGGPTREQWDMILKTGPLTSRTICGEAGAIHLVQDSLSQDARMVPLLRAIAAAKDGSTMHHSKDFNPFPARSKSA